MCAEVRCGIRRATKHVSVAAVLLVLFLSPLHVLAAGQEGHETGWGWIETLGRWANLLILFGVLAYFLRAPLRNFLAGRAAGIKDEIRTSAEAYEQAKAEKIAMEERVRRIDEELARIREDAEKEAEAERRRIGEQAERDAHRLVEAARREIENSARTAQKELKEYAGQLAVELAEKQIRAEMKPQDESRVVDRFFVTLGGSGSRERRRARDGND